ncbi:hypothetical protein CNYM01_13215 [Colletotrichum nymphaeae SA-01]|uniref:Uncharacterized protein n=1 Tax=Colletotrichum nymphaeae SA-01 TaxID=1460502 RepID=A0A135T2V7_9PEZI|nr:hypothetical protein CNYM01_13215 [Colletotrichum nymphaeae SA-01]
MRLGSAGLAALLWSSFTTAFPFVDNGSKPLPVLRPRQTGTGSTPTSTTPVATTPAASTETTVAAEATTTVTITTTVGGGGGGTVTSTTVFLRTVTTTVVVTSTTFQTTTITSNDVATATVTNYVTSTVLAKRSLNFLPVLDAPYDAPAAQITPAADANDLRRYGVIEKRALVTVVVTVSGSAGADSTVLATRTSTVLLTTTSNTILTSMVTSTLFNNAQTTITVESTLTVTSTSIDTAAPTTVESGPTTGSLGTATATGGAQSTGSSSGGGLSTGAQAGIGVGVGIVGLAALIGIGYWFYKRRKANRPSRADLDDMRAYDPNGPSPLSGPGGGMSETGAGYGGAAAGAAALGAGAGTQRRQPVPKHQLSPPSQSVSPMTNSTVSPAGAGYGSRPPTGGAQELGGTRILPAEMGGDEVVEMGESQPRPQQPPQQQSRPAPGMTYNSGPVPDVYEMPTERYR